MQKPPRYGLIRRLLFPYSGEEPLTFRQSVRVMLAWALLIPLIIALLVLAVTLPAAISLQRVLAFFVIAFLSGVGIFGILGLLVVLFNNHAARVRQAWKAQKGQ